MFKLKQNGNSESVISLTPVGWIGILIVVVSIVSAFLLVKFQTTANGQEIECIKKDKLDKHEYTTDWKEHNYRDSVNKADIFKSLKKIEKKLNIND
jgi:hypothetical protein